MEGSYVVLREVLVDVLLLLLACQVKLNCFDFYEELKTSSELSRKETLIVTCKQVALSCVNRMLPITSSPNLKRLRNIVIVANTSSRFLISYTFVERTDVTSLMRLDATSTIEGLNPFVGLGPTTSDIP